MGIIKTIDFTEFDGLLIEQAMIDMGFTERHVRVVEKALADGATVDDLVGRLLLKFPTWLGRANSLNEIATYLKNGRRAEE